MLHLLPLASNLDPDQDLDLDLTLDLLIVTISISITATATAARAAAIAEQGTCCFATYIDVFIWYLDYHLTINICRSPDERMRKRPNHRCRILENSRVKRRGGRANSLELKDDAAYDGAANNDRYYPDDDPINQPHEQQHRRQPLPVAVPWHGGGARELLQINANTNQGTAAAAADALLVAHKPSSVVHAHPYNVANNAAQAVYTGGVGASVVSTKHVKRMSKEELEVEVLAVRERLVSC